MTGDKHRMQLVSSTGPISIASTSKERSCRILPVDISKNSTPITLKGSKTNAPKSFLKNKKENQTSYSSVRWPCGCLKTSDKLKVLLQQFPSPPPPSPDLQSKSENTSCISAFCTNDHEPFKQTHVEGWDLKENYGGDVFDPTKKSWSSAQSWRLVSVIGQIVQIFVTATALAFYYIIYCYMQLIYFTLRSALFFHNADGPMKITIAVVTATSLLLGFNLLLRMERMIGIKFLIK